MKTILSFGGGVDSTAILAMHLNRDRAADQLGITRAALDEALPHVDGVMFSDTGAEFDHTYGTLDLARTLCEDAGLPFQVVKKNGESITELMIRLGTVPVMAGGSHVCSMRFKGDVLAAEARATYGEGFTWLIGIEANEGKRVTRFKKSKKVKSSAIYPLITLGLDRAACQRLLEKLWPAPVLKSSCTFCPFMSVEEIKNLWKNHPEKWQLAKKIEAGFRATSPIKHQAWLEAGKPLNTANRAPRGMWKLDSWKEGRRLFIRKLNKKELSVEEWEAHFISEEKEGEAMDGKELREAREALQLTQKQLAEKLAVTPNTVARWERDERKAPGALLGLAMQALAS